MFDVSSGCPWLSTTTVPRAFSFFHTDPASCAACMHVKVKQDGFWMSRGGNTYLNRKHIFQVCVKFYLNRSSFVSVLNSRTDFHTVEITFIDDTVLDRF
jgi:hypothetical protein